MTKAHVELLKLLVLFMQPNIYLIKYSFSFSLSLFLLPLSLSGFIMLYNLSYAFFFLKYLIGQSSLKVGTGPTFSSFVSVLHHHSSFHFLYVPLTLSWSTTHDGFYLF